MQYPQIAQRVFHTPLLATPAKAAGFVEGLGPRILGNEQIEITGLDGQPHVGPSARPFASLLDDRLGGEIRDGRRDAYRILDGAAVIPVTGTLIHRGAFVGSYSGETSYEGIGAQIDAAVADRSVRGIALEIDSHGGEVAGCFDLADRIRAACADKPVYAFICDHAFSAAYALAAQADHVVIPRAGGAGSIGVICLHVDYSGMNEAAGVRVSVISAGAHKADGNPYEPLPDDVRDSVQGEMEALRTLFAQTAALATEAGCFLGDDAVARGLADEVASPRQAFGRFIAHINGWAAGLPITAINTGADPMNKETVKDTVKDAAAATPQAPDPSITPTGQTPVNQDPVNQTPVSQVPEAADAALQGQDGPAQTPDAPDAAAEKRRIAAILNSPLAAGREQLARSLALNSDMSADEAQVHLAAAPAALVGRTLSEEIDQGETDLDMPGASAPENPVLAAQRQRWN